MRPIHKAYELTFIFFKNPNWIQSMYYSGTTVRMQSVSHMLTIAARLQMQAENKMRRWECVVVMIAFQMSFKMVNCDYLGPAIHHQCTRYPL